MKYWVCHVAPRKKRLRKVTGVWRCSFTPIVIQGIKRRKRSSKKPQRLMKSSWMRRSGRFMIATGMRDCPILDSKGSMVLTILLRVLATFLEISSASKRDALAHVRGEEGGQVPICGTTCGYPLWKPPSVPQKKLKSKNTYFVQLVKDKERRQVHNLRSALVVGVGDR